MVDDNTLLLVGSALLIAAFFAMKDKDDPSKVEAMEEDDDLPLRDYGHDRSGRLEPRI